MSDADKVAWVVFGVFASFSAAYLTWLLNDRRKWWRR